MAYATVGIDLGEISLHDLQRELRERNEMPSEDFETRCTAMYIAFKLGKDDEAMTLARSIAQDFAQPGGTL